MGVVYEAVQTSLKRRVAVKLLADWALSNPQHRERFVQEAEIAARMRHPNIVEVHDVGVWGERPYFVMELLEGRSVADELEKGAMSTAEIATIMLPVMSAVAAAHDRGVVHRDLKPENIFIAELDSGLVPKVLDFGISQIVTRPGRIESYAYGTPHYMAPELISGAGCDERSDQYSLGVILHELVKGRHPYAELAASDVLRHSLERPYPAPDLVGVPSAFRDIILRATQHDPAERFADVRDMTVALREISPNASSAGAVARAGDTSSRASRMTTQGAPNKRRSLAGLVTTLAFLASVGVGVFFGTRSSDADVGPTGSRVSIAPIEPPVGPTRMTSAQQEPQAEAVPMAEAAALQEAPEAQETAARPVAAMAMASMRRRPRQRTAVGPVSEGADPWGSRALPPEPIGSRMTKLDPWTQ